MNQVTVSPKYRVVIPKSIREMLDVKPGKKMRIIAFDNKVIFIPVRLIQNARGSLKGIVATVDREEDRF